MNVLITCCLGDFMRGTVKCLKDAFSDVKVIGVDMEEKHFHVDYIDVFYKVCSSDDPDYIYEIIDICKKEEVDVVIPIHTYEIDLFGEKKDMFDRIGVVVAASDVNIDIVNNKDRLYEFMKNNGIKCADYYVVKDENEMNDAISKIGESDACIKKPYGCGGRGFNVCCDISSTKSIMFPIIVQKYLTGDEYTVDCFCSKGNVIYYCVKKNYEMENGVAVKAVTLDEPKIAEDCKRVCELLKLDGCIGFDLKADKDGDVFIIDCNPRLTATISLSCTTGVNYVECLVKNALGMPVPVYQSRKYGVHIVRKKVDYFYE